MMLNDFHVLSKFIAKALARNDVLSCSDVRSSRAHGTGIA